MDLKAFDAASAYAKTVATGNVGGVGNIAGGNDAVGGGEFTDMLKGMMNDVSQATTGSERTAAQALNGQAGIIDVVTDVSNAEMVLNTVVAVRDKVIAAYNDIVKMPI